VKFWITKYATTEGIFEVEGEVTEIASMLRYSDQHSCNRYVHGEGRDWHRTKESAIARAEVMRKAKLASLRKSIAKLEAKRFT
jgi:hypothetical protein